MKDNNSDSLQEAKPQKVPQGYESYTGVVFNTDKNEFKVVKGPFKDKRDMYDKMTKQDRYLRRAYESKIWDWIQDNAQTPLDGYLMMSTAVSKWINNNALSKYYKKLLHDLPYINREGRKGDPQTMGISANGFGESLEIEEAYDDTADKERLKNAQTEKHDIRVYGLDKEGNRIPDAVLDLPRVELFSDLYNRDLSRVPENKRAKALRDKVLSFDLYRQMYLNTASKRGNLNGATGYDIVVDEKESQPITMTYQDLMARYKTMNKNAAFNPIKNISGTENLQSNIRHLKKIIDDLETKYDLSDEDRNALLNVFNTELANTKETLKRVYNAEHVQLSDKEKKRIHYLRTMKYEINKNRGDATPQEVAQNLAQVDLEITDIYMDALRREERDARLNNTQSQLDKAELDYEMNRPLKPGNPIHGGDFMKSFTNDMDRQLHTIKNAEREQEKPEDFTITGGRKPTEKIVDRFERTHKDIDVNTVLSKVFQDYQNKTHNTIATAYDEFEKQPYKLRDALNKAYEELTGNKIQEEAHVNDGADALMYNVDKNYPVSDGTIVEDNTHTELNPELFDGNHLKTDVRDALLEIAKTFAEKLKLPYEPVDIYFTGSEANFNYNDASDIDLHLVFDFEQAGINAEILDMYLQSAKTVFNKNHDITVKGIPVEVGAENLATPLVTTGIYSVLNDSWLIEPENADKPLPDIDSALYDQIKGHIEGAIQSNDIEQVEDTIKMLRDMRKKSLAEDGEFGLGNILFKQLRADGLMDRLKQAYYDNETRDLSLESILESEFASKDEARNAVIDALLKDTGEIKDALSKEPKLDENDLMNNTNVKPSDGYISFGDECRKIAEEAIKKIQERQAPEGYEQDAYVSGMKDQAKIDELLQLCYNGIHPDIKYKGAKLVDPKTNKIYKLLHIEKGDDPHFVVVGEMQVLRDEDGDFKPVMVDKKEMTIEDFKDIMNASNNEKEVTRTTGNEDLEDLIDDIQKRADIVNHQYQNWYAKHNDEYQLDTYPARYRYMIYDMIVHKGWRPEAALARFQTGQNWRNKKPIVKNEASLEEDREGYLSYDKQGPVVRELLQKVAPDLVDYLKTSFEANLYDDIEGEDAEPARYYNIVGLPNLPEDQIKTAFVKEVGKKGMPTELTLDEIREYISTGNNIEDAKIDRARDAYLGSNKMHATKKDHEWLELETDEILNVLERMEKTGDPRYKGLISSYKNSKDNHRPDKYVTQALKDFDPDLRDNVRGINGKYYIALPGKKSVGANASVKKHTGSNPLNDLRRISNRYF